MIRYREKQKALASGGANSKDNSKDNSKVNVSVLDKIREDKIREDKNYIKRFVPPSLEEVTAYCRERHNDVNPQKWHDFYSAKGWMVGKNKMKDWKAAIRTWEKPKENALQRRHGGKPMISLSSPQRRTTGRSGDYHRQALYCGTYRRRRISFAWFDSVYVRLRSC